MAKSPDPDKYEEFEDVADYFPYIDHELDVGRDSLHIQEKMIGGLFEEYRSLNNSEKILEGPNYLYTDVELHASPKHKRIAEDENAVELLVPRHRSLFDYAILQPIHHDFINMKIVILAGHNLFVGKFDDTLRYFGAFMYLRDNTVLKREGLKKVYLSKPRYQREVFPSYIRKQVFTKDDGPRHDFLVFIEYEKDPETGKSNAGRTKIGRLRELNWSFLKLLYQLASETGTKLYITPLNISFSKIPDAVYVVHPTKLKGNFKTIRYLTEQHFVFDRYPKYARSHEDAKLSATIRYGDPELINDYSFESFRDFRDYGHKLKDKIGELETVFPCSFIYSCMDEKTEISITELSERMKQRYGYYRENNIYTSRLEKNGTMLQAEELIDRAITSINANPGFSIPGYNHNKILVREGNTIVSYDSKLQSWYANSIRHLGPSY